MSVTHQHLPTNISIDSIQNKRVVSLDDGKQIGYVEDLLLDPQKLHLAALIIKGETGQSILPLDKIHSIGDDAITVDGMKSTQSAADSLPGVKPLSEFRDQNIVDSAGTILGKLHDVIFDTATGCAALLEVHKGGVFGLGAQILQVPAGDVRSFGPDLITVNEVAGKD